MFYSPVRDAVSLAPGFDVKGADPLEVQVQELPNENDKSSSKCQNHFHLATASMPFQWVINEETKHIVFKFG